jgi:hypothetical protein
MKVFLLDRFPQLCVVLRISNWLNPRYHCPFSYDDREEAVVEGLSQVQRQKSRPREEHRDTDSAQDAGAPEENAAPWWGKWRRHSCLCAVDEAWDSEPGKPRGIANLRFFTALSPSSKTSKFDAET